MTIMISSLCIVCEQPFCFLRETGLRKQELVRSCMHDTVLTVPQGLEQSDT